MVAALSAVAASAASPAGAAVRTGVAPARIVVVADVPLAPAHAHRLGRLAGRTSLHLDLVLRPRQPAALTRFVSEVSTPGSPLFRHFLARGTFGAVFGQTAADVGRIRSRLRADGLTPGRLSADRLVLPVVGAAGAVERAFGTAIDRFESGGRVVFAPARPPRLPAWLAAQVQTVEGMDDLPPALATGRRGARPDVAPARRTTTTAPAASPACLPAPPRNENPTNYPGYWIPSQLERAYDITPLYAQGENQGDPGGLERIALFETGPFQMSDIDFYESCYGDSSLQPDVIGVGGATTSCSSASTCDEEAAADVEDILGLVPDLGGLDVYVTPNGSPSGLLQTWDAIASGDDATVSTSVGICEQADSDQYAVGEQPVFEEMAAQGQSVFAATGDDGSESQACDDGGTQSFPQLWDPSSQPTVTAVGGSELTALGTPPTTLGSPPVAVPSETVWNDRIYESAAACPCTYPARRGGAGGGGVSTVWASPSYQTGDAIGYAGAPCGQSSGYCREVPDVSASADAYHGFPIFYEAAWDKGKIGGVKHGVGGTSLATPLWASITALGDNACNARFGLLNPSLYQIAGANDAADDLNDISGPSADNNDYTGTLGKYPVLSGYDMATGLGTPVGANLEATLCAEPFLYDQDVTSSARTGSGSQFGASVASLVYGAPGASQNRGAAYAESLSTGGLVEVTAPDGAAGDHFGAAASGYAFGYFAVGAPDHSGGGAVYVYADGPTLDQELQPPSSAVHFGSAVSLSSLLIVGAPGNKTVPGQVDVYQPGSSGGSWTLLATLTAPAGTVDGGLFGSAVTMPADANQVIVGDPGVKCSRGADCGSVFVYDYSGSSVTLAQTLQPSDVDAGSWFGSSISSDQVLVVGARQGLVRSGTAYVYDLSGTSWQFPADGELFDAPGFASGKPGPVSVLALEVPEGCGPDDVVLGTPAVTSAAGTTYGEVGIWAPGQGSYDQAAVLLDPFQSGLGGGSATDAFGTGLGTNGGQLYVGTPGLKDAAFGGSVGGIVGTYGSQSICP